MKLNNLLKLKSKRIELRKALTPAEATLWKHLQNSQMEGRKFRRQHSVGNYIIDFHNSDVVDSYKLIIQGIDKNGKLIYKEQIIK